MPPFSLGAHLPWSRCPEDLPRILAWQLFPEFAFKGLDLDDLDWNQVRDTAALLAEKGVRPTVHAPFFDLNPGALDPLIRKVTGERLSQTLAIAAELNAALMVVHPGFDRWRYPGLDEAWADHATQFFPPLLDQAAQADCPLALENIYEQTPATLVQLVETLDSPFLGHCFDIGHWHLFGTLSLPVWLAAIGPRLLHLHLHDNHGLADEHLPVGTGQIDFRLLFSSLGQLARQPSMTLEAHSPDHLILSLRQSQTLVSEFLLSR